MSSFITLTHFKDKDKDGDLWENFDRKLHVDSKLIVIVIDDQINLKPISLKNNESNKFLGITELCSGSNKSKENTSESCVPYLQLMDEETLESKNMFFIDDINKNLYYLNNPDKWYKFCVEDECKSNKIDYNKIDYNKIAYAWKKAGHRYEEADKCYEEADKCYEEAYKYYESIESLKKNADTLEEVERNLLKVNTLNKAGLCFEFAGECYKLVEKNNNAFVCYEKVGECYKLAGEIYEKAGTIKKAGDCYKLAGEFYKLAGEIYEKENIGNKVGKCYELAGDCYEFAGDCYELAGDCYELAGEFYEKACKCYEKEKNYNKKAGMNFKEANKLDCAVEFYKKHDSEMS